MSPQVQPLRFALESPIDIGLHAVAPLVKAIQLQMLKELDPALPMLYTAQTKLKRSRIYCAMECSFLKSSSRAPLGSSRSAP